MNRDTALAIAMAAKESDVLELKTLMQLLHQWAGSHLDEKLKDLEAESLLQAAKSLKLESTMPSSVALAQLAFNLRAQVCEQLKTKYNDKKSLRIALASNSADKLDGHFGSCDRFLIYTVSADEAYLEQLRCVEEPVAGEDQSLKRAKLISDCQLLYVLSIGGPAAAKVIRSGIHPIKKTQACAAPELITQLQAVLQDGAPPWLAKQLSQGKENRVRFKRALTEEVG
ncbi:NifB/NifX family molybdenum-iron cluster-binding protein [Agaribacterium sp. ZY112]|uniref:NifB/NifX family molybdenum-iron cluster-binding protein n=1 Tax=Agaribacterium sp. ZY112 TaxID=3233574 RepID=UPI0035254476